MLGFLNGLFNKVKLRCVNLFILRSERFFGCYRLKVDFFGFASFHLGLSSFGPVVASRDIFLFAGRTAVWFVVICILLVIFTLFCVFLLVAAQEPATDIRVGGYMRHHLLLLLLQHRHHSSLNRPE